MNRQVFYYKGNYYNEIKAGGVLFYQFNKQNELQLLLINKNGIYEDFGGKTEFIDSSIFDTITREVIEESNNVLNNEFFKDKLSYNQKHIYIKKSKYLLFLIKLEQHYDLNNFGNMEIINNIPRTVELIDYIDFKNIKLHIRLINNNAINKIKNQLYKIANNHKVNI